VRIEHAAIWTHDLERLRAFYERYLDGRAGERYDNRAKEFSSYFLDFDSGARLELMAISSLPTGRGAAGAPAPGFAHLAFALGSETAVDELTRRLAADGYRVEPPRRTGDGYHEAVVLDPEGNRIELTV
jgi:lactoylglutathione lyase